MMGERRIAQDSLFYEFRLEEHVPADHQLRSIDRFVDLAALRAHLADFYSSNGRPSVDPELMIRMLLVGYCYGIRSERRLCDEVHLNLAYRWFCRLGLEGQVPDHSTFSKNRHGRFAESDVFRRLFEEVVARCIAEGLVGGEGFAVDASLIEADANRQRSVTASDWKAPEAASRSVREYLVVLDENTWGAATEVEPKFISESDPAAQWTAAKDGPAIFAYSDNYLIDLRSAVIVDVEASRSVRQAEVGAAKIMIERTAQRFDLKPDRLAADTAYGSAEMLNWLAEERKIAPHVPVIDKSARHDGTFARADFQYDKVADAYVCPGGKSLTTTGTLVNDGATLSTGEVLSIAVSASSRLVAAPTPRLGGFRAAYTKGARDLARSLAGTPAFEQSRRERKKVEMLFAHLKRILRLDRLRLRGPQGARTEFLLAATAQNLRKLAKLIPVPVT
jgi:transposase